MSKKFVNIIIIIILFCLSFFPFFWQKNSNKQYNYIGRGDYLAPVNNNLIYRNFFTISDRATGENNSVNFAHLVPFDIFFLVTNYYSVNKVTATLLLISLIIFISQLSFFSCSKYYIKKVYSSENNFKLIFLSFVGAIIYGYSPFLLSLLAPGHLMNLFNYAIFPLILRYFDILLEEKKINKKILFNLFFCFIFSAASYANFGIIYINFLLFGFYAIIKACIEKKSFITIMIRYILVFLTFMLANIWWLTSYLYDIFQQNIVSLGISKNIIYNQLPSLSQTNPIPKLFLGKIMFNYVVSDSKVSYNILNNISMLFMWLFAILGLIKTPIEKRMKLIVLMFLTLITLFLAKGYAPPFEDIYFFLFTVVPGFISLRNAPNKIFWFTWLCLLIMCVMGIYQFLKEKPNKLSFLLFSLFAGIAVFFVITFINHPQLQPFDIPSYYFEAGKYLHDQKAKRIMVLPSFEGYAPFYGEKLNGYHGIDFLPELWNMSVIAPGSFNLEYDYPYKKIAEEINQRIARNQNICEQTKTLGISHIVVIKDLNLYVGLDAKEIIESLDNMNEFGKKIEFPEKTSYGITIFPVNKSCYKELVSLHNSNAKISYSIISPVQIDIDIKNLSSKSQLDVLYNYNKAWKLVISDSYNSSIKNLCLKLVNHQNNYLLKIEPVMIYKYAISWNIDPEFIKSNYPHTTNSDGSINIKLNLFNINQIVRYITLYIFSFIFLFLIMINLIKKNK